MPDTSNVPFDQDCAIARTEIKKVGELVKNLKNGIATRPTVVGQDTSEMIANMTLAYRHLEDAAMRIGKAIQAYEGGKSIYDSNDAARVAAAGIK